MKIKTVSAFSTDSASVGNSYKSSFIEYNRTGNVINACEWSANGDIESKITTIYDTDNKIIEECNYISDDEISERYVYERNSEGKIQNIKVYYADGSESIRKYDYNTVENTKTVTIENEDGDFDGSEFYCYDEQGNILEKVILNYEKSIEEKIKYTYQDSKLIKEENFDKKGNLLFSQNFKYNENNNLTEVLKLSDKNNILEKITTIFDENNRIISQIVLNSHQIKVEYDSENRCKTEERLNLAGQLIYFTKTIYNEHELIIEEQTPAHTIKYQYEYFEEN